MHSVVSPLASNDDRFVDFSEGMERRDEGLIDASEGDHLFFPVWYGAMVEALLWLVLKEIPWRFLKRGHGQVHVKKRRERSFTTIFRHLVQNLAPNFQLELLQKSGSKDIGRFDPCSLTSHAAVNPQHQEVIFRLRSPKRHLESKVPFLSCCKEEGFYLLDACACPCYCKWIHNRTASY